MLLSPRNFVSVSNRRTHCSPVENPEPSGARADRGYSVCYGGEACVCDIERHFDLTQPTISHHVRVLREAGVIDGEQRGLTRFFRPLYRSLSI